MASQSPKRNRPRILRALTATGVGAAIAMSDAIAYAASAFNNHMDQLMINNLMRQLAMDRRPVHDAYERVVMTPEGIPERDAMVSGLAAALSVPQTEMDTAFDAAWHQTLKELEGINQDQFETWTGRLNVDGDLAADEARQANVWFSERPFGLSPLTLLAAYSTNPATFADDARALVEIGMIGQLAVDRLMAWHAVRPSYLPMRSVVADPPPSTA